MITTQQRNSEYLPLTMQVPRSVWVHKPTGRDAVALKLTCYRHSDLVTYRFIGETATQLIRVKSFLAQFERRLGEVP